jgi:hypothetical protein
MSSGHCQWAGKQRVFGSCVPWVPLVSLITLLSGVGLTMSTAPLPALTTRPQRADAPRYSEALVAMGAGALVRAVAGAQVVDVQPSRVDGSARGRPMTAAASASSAGGGGKRGSVASAGVAAAGWDATPRVDDNDCRAHSGLGLPLGRGGGRLEELVVGEASTSTTAQEAAESGSGAGTARRRGLADPSSRPASGLPRYSRHGAEDTLGGVWGGHMGPGGGLCISPISTSNGATGPMPRPTRPATVATALGSATSRPPLSPPSRTLGGQGSPIVSVASHLHVEAAASRGGVGGLASGSASLGSLGLAVGLTVVTTGSPPSSPTSNPRAVGQSLPSSPHTPRRHFYGSGFQAGAGVVAPGSPLAVRGASESGDPGGLEEVTWDSVPEPRAGAVLPARRGYLSAPATPAGVEVRRVGPSPRARGPRGAMAATGVCRVCVRVCACACEYMCVCHGSTHHSCSCASTSFPARLRSTPLPASPVASCTRFGYCTLK